MDATEIKFSRQTVLRVLSGYSAGCGAAAVTLAAYMGVRDSLIRSDSAAEVVKALLLAIPASLLTFVMIAILSLPTFLICRALLHLMRRSDPVSFAVAGAANAYGLVSLLLGADTLDLFLKYPPDPWVAIAGTAGGVACWWTEHQLSSQAA